MLLLAVIPGIILFFVIWKSDKVEKEPGKLLLKLFLFGALTVVSAIVVGKAGELVFGFLDPGSMLYIFIDNFLLTAFVEEAGKYVVVKKVAWKHPAFDHTFDAVVYAVTASLGFATLENIIYLIGEDISLGIIRGIMSVPGHAIYGVFMGCYFGLAKAAEAEGDKKLCSSNLKKALIIPTLLHGFYDFCIGSSEYGIFLVILLVFEIVLTVVGIRKIRKLSREDKAIAPEMEIIPGMAPETVLAEAPETTQNAVSDPIYGMNPQTAQNESPGQGMTFNETGDTASDQREVR
ncbi:MAG: PrsW family intramembrane metalloprotease [Lachnospiraceae bacterium]|nr:PrsW family intramembrane metalloprotease [Lachnospiraceae bacterium]